MPKRLFQVIKWNGDSEFFQPDKLLSSLKRAGASDKIGQRILQHVESELQDGMKTTKIYEHAFELLKEHSPMVAARYDLKKAILRLGPSGYPFEKFIAHIWERLGYKTKTGINVPGKCIDHEVDVVAENDHEVVMMECKYHNFHDTSSDIKTALYVQARMQDLKAYWEKAHLASGKKFRGLLVTNTKFSSSALRYAECAQLNIISWSYPPGGGLAHMIDNLGLHPITCLTTLSEGHIKTLLNQGLVLCQDIGQGLHSLDLSGEEKQRVEQEAHEVCKMRRK